MTLDRVDGRLAALSVLVRRQDGAERGETSLEIDRMLDVRLSLMREAGRGDLS
jgi:hypothetical protein